MNSFVLKRILSFTASIMCFHASLFAQCENPVIESITFTEKYYCSSETPEMILDFGSTKASSIAVFMADDMENSIFEVSFPLLSNILLPFRGEAGDYFDFKERVFKDIYVFAWNDEGCKSEPKKIQVPYNNINFNITWNPVLFCEGGDDIGEFHIGVGDVEIDSDITLNVYDKAGNILEPKEVVHSDKNCGWQGGCYEYTYLITNNPNERYYWDLDLSKNRCASNAGGGKTEIERFMTSPHKLSLDIEALPNVQKTSNGYVTCEGETVKLSINEENISNSVSTEIATKVEKPCTVCGWVWEYRKGSGSFTTYTKDNVLNIDPTIDDSYQFRVRSKVGSNYDACPQVVSNVISIDREKAPKFTLEATPDCDNKQVELSLVSSQTYEQSQITATANGKPISFAGNKATSAFSEDTEFEVSVSGEICPAVTKTATAEYDCVETEFSLESSVDAICYGGYIELSLVATGPYDATKVSATANGNPITLAGGKYTASLTETTKFEVVIANENGTETTLEKIVYVPLLVMEIKDKVFCEDEIPSFEVKLEGKAISCYAYTYVDGVKVPISDVYMDEHNDYVTSAQIDLFDIASSYPQDQEYYIEATLPDESKIDKMEVLCGYRNRININYEKKPDFSLKATPDCEAKEVELSLISDATYEPSQITATANGNPISFVGNKATSAFSEDTEFEVSVSGEICHAVTKNVTAEYDCENPCPVIESVENVKEYYCSSEKPEMTVDLGTTQATSFYVYEVSDKETHILEGAFPVSSNFTLQFEDMVKDLASKELYVVAVNGECKSDPVKVEISYQDISLSMVSNPALFCEGDDFAECEILVSPNVSDYTLHVYDNDGNSIEPLNVGFDETINTWGNIGGTRYTYNVSSDSTKHYFWTVETEGDKCSGDLSKHDIIRYVSPRHDLIIDLEPSPNVRKTENGYLVCNDEPVHLYLSKSNLYPFTVNSIDSDKTITIWGEWSWDIRHPNKGEEFGDGGLKNNFTNFDLLIKEPSDFKVIAKTDSRFDGCPQPESNILSVMTESKAEFSLAYEPDCDDNEVELSLASDETYEPSQITATANGKPISFAGNKATIEFKKDVEIEVSVSGEVCKSIKSEFVKYDCKESDFSLELDKDVICEEGEVEVSLVASSSYDPSQVTATANGKLITLESGKYKATINETTKFVVVINNEDGTETTLEKIVEVESKPDFYIVTTSTNCDNNRAYLEIKSDKKYDLSQIYASANGNDFSFNKYYIATVYDFTKDLNVEVTISGNTCPAVTKNHFVSLSECNKDYADSKKKVCDNEEVELQLVPSESYDPSKVSATANGKPITLTDGKYKKVFTEDTDLYVIVYGEDGVETTISKHIEVKKVPVVKSVECKPVCEDEIPYVVITTEDDAPAQWAFVYYYNEGGKMIFIDENAGGITKYDMTSITKFMLDKASAYPLDKEYYIMAEHSDSYEYCHANPFPFHLNYDKKPDFSLEATLDCEAKEVELSLISDAAYEPSQITATANGKPISFAGNKATAEFTEDTEFEVSVSGEICPAVTKNVTAEYDCVETKFSIKVDKVLICEGDDVELTLVASGTYDETKVSATANGKPIKLIDGKYTASLAETTKFEVVIANEDGTETTLETIVFVDKLPKIEIEDKVFCEDEIPSFEVKLEGKTISCFAYTYIDGVVVQISDVYMDEDYNYITSAHVDLFDIASSYPQDQEYYIEATLSIESKKSEVTGLCGSTIPFKINYEKKPDFSLEATPDCEAKEVELSLVSDAAYDPSQITATANGKPISFAGKKATAEFVKDIEFEVTVASELCPAVTKNVTAEYDCVETKFSIEVDKESICEGDDVELTLVASGTYDETKVSATANGKPIKLTDGKYISALTETTKFEMVISNFDGTETKLEKTVDVEHPSSFTINTDKTTVCDGEDVTLTTSFSSTNFDESSIIISNANETLATGQQSVVITPLSSMIVKAEALTTSGCKMNAEPVSIFVSNISLRDVPGDTTVCEGDEIKLSVSDKNDYKYNWTILGDTVSNTNQMELICIKTTNVKLEASLNDCKNVYDFVINVAPTPRIVSVEDKSDYEYEIIAEGGTGDYQYDLGDGYSSSSTFINHLSGKIYHIYVKDELGCKADTIYKIPIVEIEIPIFFTPNGDGDNDLWVVKNLDKYPSANVRLYDRWGKQLVSTTSAEFEGWDGTYNGNALPSTDYWYEIDIEEIDKIYTGHFTLIRGGN